MRQSEISTYIALYAPLQEKEGVLQWWMRHKALFPILFQLVRKYLAIPASSTPSEELWSDAGNIVTKKRTRLTDEHVCQLLYCFEARQFLSKI